MKKISQEERNAIIQELRNRKTFKVNLVYQNNHYIQSKSKAIQMQNPNKN